MEKFVFTALLSILLRFSGSISTLPSIYNSVIKTEALATKPFPIEKYSMRVMTVTTVNEADIILGTWLSEHADGKILIYKNNGKYFGRLSWIKRRNVDGSPVLDVKNPEPAKQKEKVMGLEILKGFKYAGGKTWNGGFIYDPLSGKTYSCRISTDNSIKIKIRGFIGIPLFGRSTFWTRSN